MLVLQANSTPLGDNPAAATGDRYMCPVKSCRQLFQYRETLAQHSRSRHNRTYEPVILKPTEIAPAPEPYRTGRAASAPERTRQLSSPDAAPIPKNEPAKSTTSYNTRGKKRKAEPSPPAIQETPPPATKRSKRGNQKDVIKKETETTTDIWKEVKEFDKQATLISKYEFWMNRYEEELRAMRVQYQAMAGNKHCATRNSFQKRADDLEIEGKALKERIRAAAEKVQTGVLATLRQQLQEREKVDTVKKAKSRRVSH